LRDVRVALRIQLEISTALFVERVGEPRIVAPVRLNDNRVITLLGAQEVVNGDAARIRFREFMRKREEAATVAFPGKVFAVSNIPIRVPEHFLDHEHSLAAIDTALGRFEGRVAITRCTACAECVGKTTLAALPM
jgi:hypothetical protein